MDEALQVFSYNDKKLRTTEQNGVIWFVAKDVCDMLGHTNARKAVKSLDSDEKMTVTNSYSHSGQRGGAQFITFVNEPGMYKLIFKSRKSEAKEFTRWVTHEVLPQIRQHGMYLTDRAAEIASSDPESFDKLLAKYVAECKKSQELQERINSDRAFTNLGHVVLALPGSMTVQAAAHFLAQYGFDIGQNRLFKKCREEGFLCKRKGRQYNQPTQKAIERGLFNSEINGGFRPIAMVTPKGLSYLTEKFAVETYPLLLLMESEGETE